MQNENPSPGLTPLPRHIDLSKVIIDTALLFNPRIINIEVTQAIQYQRADQHLTDVNDRAPDNSVTLIANKPAWARVYVRSGILGNQNVTGELFVERTRPLTRISWFPVGTLLPQPPGTTTAEHNPDYVTERSILNSTLNFIIPAEMLWGRLRITARIRLQGSHPDSWRDDYRIVVDATLLQTLRLRGVMISYNGPDPIANPTNPPNINLAAPTLADLQATAAWTLTTNPVQSTGVFSTAGSITWNTPLTGVATSPGGCSTQWVNLNAAVERVKVSDGNRNDVIYYGLLPDGVPIQNVGGCESSGVSTGPNGAQVTMAHEVGHGAGLSHAPCGTPGDLNYPAYELHDPPNNPTASIGEYGLDINNGTIHPPTEKDYMSYCGPKWISLYHHARLTNNEKFDPRIVGWRYIIYTPPPPLPPDPFVWPWEYMPDPPSWERSPGDLRMKSEKVISIIGIMTEDRKIDVQSVMRLTALPDVKNALQTDLVAQLVGRDGNIVAQTPVVKLVSRGCDCNDKQNNRASDQGPFVFQALVPDLELGASLRILRKGGVNEEGDKELWVRQAPEHEPKIKEFNVRITDEGQGYANWKAECAPNCTLDFSLQFSKDGGRSWNSLAVGIREDSHKFNLGDLPSGSVIFRLLVHDGFFTSTLESKTVELPRHAPVISILHPQTTSAINEGAPMRLWGAVSSDSFKPVDPSACVWIVDGREVGRGTDTWTTAPERGEHKCTFIVEDNGGRSEANTSFTTISSEIDQQMG